MLSLIDNRYFCEAFDAFAVFEAWCKRDIVLEPFAFYKKNKQKQRRIIFPLVLF